MWLRLWLEQQVTIRSPIPESPAKVSSLPPSFIPSLPISEIPLVIRAAFALSPSPKPSITPAARAITFLSEPPSSIPMISGLVYTLNLSDIKASCIMQAISLDFAPTTAVVGIPRDTSSA